MRINIETAGGNVVSGESHHGRWDAGMQFSYGGKNYRFNGKDREGILHATRLHDNKRVTFERSSEWNPV